jgi:hypothetical protein
MNNHLNALKEVIKTKVTYKINWYEVHIITKCKLSQQKAQTTYEVWNNNSKHKLVEELNT